MTYHKAKGDSDDHLAMEHCFENTVANIKIEIFLVHIFIC